MNSDSASEALEAEAYYRASRRWYSELFHTPIAERSYYIIIIVLALINGYFAILSFAGVFPLTIVEPFPTYTNDIFEDLPRIRRLALNQKEDRNFAVMRYLIETYVKNRESYDLKLYELRYRNIWSGSDARVFEHYKSIMDASNPYSPYRLYTNKAERDAEVLSVTFPDKEHAQVVFGASVTSTADGSEMSYSKWQADIAFAYTNFSVDQSLDEHAWVARLLGLTGKTVKASGEERKVVPMTFRVSDYQVKELLE